MGKSAAALAVVVPAPKRPSNSLACQPATAGLMHGAALKNRFLGPEIRPSTKARGAGRPGAAERAYSKFGPVQLPAGYAAAQKLNWRSLEKTALSPASAAPSSLDRTLLLR